MTWITCSSGSDEKDDILRESWPFARMPVSRAFVAMRPRLESCSRLPGETGEPGGEALRDGCPFPEGESRNARFDVLLSRDVLSLSQECQPKLNSRRSTLRTRALVLALSVVGDVRPLLEAGECGACRSMRPRCDNRQVFGAPPSPLSARVR